MPKVRALSPDQAKRSLANKFGPLASRLRQIAVNLGARPYRVFLNWTKWTGKERGAGDEVLVLRREILPTPKVESLDSVTFSIFHAGTIPAGSVRVREIAIDTFTEDQLRGLDATDPETGASTIPRSHVKRDGAGLLEPYDFFYEVVEDGRGDAQPVRDRYRLLSKPFREATKVYWTILLERVGPDRTRDDHSPFPAPGRP